MKFKHHHRTLCALYHIAARLNIEFDNPLFWSETEDNLLIMYYPKYGEIECSKHLPNRSVKACKARARVLKLYRLCDPFFSTAEESIIKNYYQIEGGDCYLRMNGSKTKCQVMHHAQQLGIKATTNSANKWTEAENDLIRQYYPIEGKACSMRLPGRNERTVMCQASKLGVIYKKSTVKPKLVLCVETNIVYNSLREAAQSTNNTAGKISMAARGLRKTVGGYHWKYVEED